jgi:hypothetical protein
MNNYNKLSGEEFERFVFVYLSNKGFTNLIQTPKTGDYGADIIAEFDDKKYSIQCKRQQTKVGVKAVNEVLGGKSYYKCDFAMIVTNSYFTPNAINAAKNSEIILLDGNDLDSNNKSFYEIQKQYKDSSRLRYTDNDLIDNYNQIKSQIGREPKTGDLNNKRYSKIASPTYQRRYGGLNEFKKMFNIELKNKTYTKDELKKIILDISKKIGETPTIEDLKNHTTVSHSTFSNQFGSWNECLVACGLEIHKKNNTEISKKAKEKIKKEYMRIKEKLGRQPTTKDIQIESSIITNYEIVKNFQSYNDFLLVVENKRGNKPYTREELVENYFKVKRRLKITNRPLTTTELEKNGEIFRDAYRRFFKSYQLFLQEIGE